MWPFLIGEPMKLPSFEKEFRKISEYINHYAINLFFEDDSGDIIYSIYMLKSNNNVVLEHYSATVTTDKSTIDINLFNTNYKVQIKCNGFISKNQELEYEPSLYYEHFDEVHFIKSVIFAKEALNYMIENKMIAGTQNEYP